jgi:hypothetical protein
MKKLPVLLLLICVCGCSPQKRLMHRLKEADRVIFACNGRGYEDVSITVKGAEADKILRAIATGQSVSRWVTATPDFRLEFYRGGKHLGTITNSLQVFWIEHAPFRDTTRALEELYHRAREEHPPSLSR